MNSEQIAQARVLARLLSVAEQREVVDGLLDEIERLRAERDRLRGLIDGHNQDCIARCGEGEQEGVRCGPRRCPECPRHGMIEIAALEDKCFL